ncbi:MULTISPECIES: hypothetical protein [Streptomyces]|uniref:Uncharacterized protein n=1 Tax=Streptomyces eurythermus TaxID=42237 RepID=A0ABW6Z985_9ACTN|nr:MULTISPECIES: hypothetical protein [Streptomyces]QIS68610.1 hypothetical protein HB370_00400 [Streptomyces sp. DSM 40868]
MLKTTSAVVKKFSAFACVAMFAIAGAFTLTPAADAHPVTTASSAYLDNNGWQ